MAKTKRSTLEISKKKKSQKAQKQEEQKEEKKELNTSTCACKSENKECHRLPPISSLVVPPFYSNYYFDAKYMTKKPAALPIIPYYYHHRQFGIESCMLQLMENEKMASLYDY